MSEKIRAAVDVLKGENRMKKLFLLYWIISVYSGDTGRLTFRTEEHPKFIQKGRWIQFVDFEGRNTCISAGSTVLFYEGERENG